MILHLKFTICFLWICFFFLRWKKKKKNHHCTYFNCTWNQWCIGSNPYPPTASVDQNFVGIARLFCNCSVIEGLKNYAGAVLILILPVLPQSRYLLLSKDLYNTASVKWDCRGIIRGTVYRGLVIGIHMPLRKDIFLFGKLVYFSNSKEFYVGIFQSALCHWFLKELN